MAGMAQVRIPLPFTPVPITGQTFAVLLVGAVLGSRRGAASLLLYLMQGLVGLPFFAGGTSGLAILLGPTGGYLVGFIVAAYLVGLLAARGLDRRIPSALLAFLAGESRHLSLRRGLVERLPGHTARQSQPVCCRS